MTSSNKVKERNPLESFGPEIKEALLKGSRERFILPFPSSARATAFQRRCNGLRAALRRREHPDYKAVARCRVSVYRRTNHVADRDDFLSIEREAGIEAPAYVVCSPHDADFREVLEKAGIKFTPDNHGHDLEAARPDGDGDTFLDSLKKEKPL
jgi:hypothetical protein